MSDADPLLILDITNVYVLVLLYAVGDFNKEHFNGRQLKCSQHNGKTAINRIYGGANLQGLYILSC